MWESSLLSFALPRGFAFLREGCKELLRGGEQLGGRKAGLPPACGRELKTREALRAGKLCVVRTGPFLALSFGLRWKDTSSFPLIVSCVSVMTGSGPLGVLVRLLWIGYVWVLFGPPRVGVGVAGLL